MATPSRPHVWIAETDGRVALEVEDWELLDFIDDYLTEAVGLEYDACIPQGGSPERHRLVFREGTRGGSMPAGG
jgi:hypothetical protein